MPTLNVKIYEFDPLGVISSAPGGNFTYTGPAEPGGTAIITDNQAGANGLALEDAAVETATATTVIDGVSAGAANVYAEESWTLRDSVTGKEFQVVTFRIDSGPNVGWYTLSEVPLIQGRTYETLNYDTTPNAANGDAVFSYADYAESDNIVDGTSGDDVIDASYAGDPGNDVVDGNDMPSDAPNVASDFNWSGFADEQDLRAGVTQDTGEVDVTVSYSDVQTNENFSAENSGGADAIYVAPGETFASNSAGYLLANGSADNTTITFDFEASAGADFKDSVENVRFRISDIDGINNGTANFQDIVTVRAFDAFGNEIDVDITGGSNHVVSGNTITGNLTNFAPNSPQASALIEIAGPVSQITVVYDNGGTSAQAIYFSDIQFDAVPIDDNDDSIDAGGGNDVVLAGDGDDTVRGGLGDDTLTGGAGADVLTGNEGDDVFNVGTGDTASGGDGDDTFVIDPGELGGGTLTVTGGEGDEADGDVLDFNGQLQPGSVTLLPEDDASGGKSGSATLLDGTVVNFSEIETIICFTKGALIATPFGERAIETLMPGDLVLTRDKGPQPLRWIGKRTVQGRGQFAHIEFTRGAIGNTSPLRVSPRHRMLIADWRAPMLFGADEVLTAADYLVNGVNVIRRECVEVTYYHLLFDNHELVQAGGIWSESYQPGDYSLPGLDPREREGLFHQMPHLRSDPNSYGPAARLSLRRQQAHLLTPNPAH